VVTVQSVPIFTAEGIEIAEIQITFRLARLVRAEICSHFSAHFAFSAVKIDPQLNGYKGGERCFMISFRSKDLYSGDA
jgi:hypothetical protein